MSTSQFSYDTREIDMDALDPEDRKVYPRFVRRHGRWLVAVYKTYEARTGEYVQVLRNNGTVRVVELQDQVLFQPYNMKRGTKDVFLCKDVTAMLDKGIELSNCHILRLDGAGRCDPDVCLLRHQ